MKAMVLCAGLGTRLRPFTERWPKPALPFLGQPLLRYHLSVLKRAGVTAVGINTHHLGETMRAVAESECARAGLPLKVVHEEVLQGTGGGIRGLRHFLADDDFIVFNGDTLFPVELAPVVAAHRAAGAAATMVLLPLPAGEKYSAVELDAEQRVQRVAGKGPGGEGLTPWHFSGVHVMSPRVFEFMSPSGAEDIVHDVYLRMMAAGHAVHGAPVQAYWSDLGTPRRYLATQLQVLSGVASLDAFGADSPFLDLAPSGARVFTRPGAEPGHARVVGPAFLDQGVQLAHSARVGPGVSLGARVRVGEGAQIRRSAVFEDTEIAPEEELEDVLAWGAHRISAAR